MTKASRIAAIVTAAAVASVIGAGSAQAAPKDPEPTVNICSQSTSVKGSNNDVNPDVNCTLNVNSSNGVSGYEIVNSSFTVSGEDGSVSEVIFCPPGKRAIGGGASVDDLDQAEQINMTTSGPVLNGLAWQVSVESVSPVTTEGQLSAVCANVDS